MVEKINWKTFIFNFEDGTSIHASENEFDFVAEEIQIEQARGNRLSNIKLTSLLYSTNQQIFSILANFDETPTHFETINISKKGNFHYKKEPIIYN